MVDFDALEDVLDREGEVHAVLEEHDRELEIRKGQFDRQPGKATFAVHTSVGSQYIDKERLIRYYVPQEIWH